MCTVGYTVIAEGRNEHVFIRLQVGRETISSSDDQILRQDMPAALIKVEKASKLLEEASSMLKQDPYSAPAR